MPTTTTQPHRIGNAASCFTDAHPPLTCATRGRVPGGRRWRRTGALLALVLGATNQPAHAGPPFLTDDPEPVPYGHWEFYRFATIDAARDASMVQAPAFEFNYGITADLQGHVVFPFMTAMDRNSPTVFGPGDTEVGAKYRFAEETDAWPMAGIFPLLELPTGDADRGLGNGTTWVKLPLWLQKSWGDEPHQWTTYGGGGVALNAAAGQHDYPFGGWLLQRDLGGKLSLAGELFAQGKTTDAGQAALIANLGGTYNFTQSFSFLFALGHTLTGEAHLIGYAGLYVTW